MEISLNLNVLFDLTARMAKTLPALAGRQPQPAAPTPTALPESAESDKPAPASDKPTPAPEPVAPAPEPAPTPAPAQTKELTAEDVRDAIHRTRLRFEGDYVNNRDTEEYNRYHGALNTLFKQSSMA